MNNKDEIGLYMHIYLDDRIQRRCMEMRVKWESFERPAFGELLIQIEESGQPVNPFTYKPRIGDMRVDDVWVESVTGQIYVDLDERGKELLGYLKKVLL